MGEQYSGIHWVNVFDEALDISPNDVLEEKRQSDDTFRVYLKNFKSPYAPSREPGRTLEPQECSKTSDYQNMPTLVALHGGGYSGLTWAPFARCMEDECKCRILSVDLRGHGDTRTSDEDQMDINTLVDDVIRVIHATHRVCGFTETPRIVLIGHSMGGAIAVKVSARCAELLPSLVGFVIIDVVEGTAKDALPLMLSVIQTRPTKFTSLEEAIRWSWRSGMTKNRDSARMSMPGNLVNIESGHLAIHDMETPKGKEHLMTCIRRNKFDISPDRWMSARRTSMPPPVIPYPRVTALSSSELSKSTRELRTPTMGEGFDEAAEEIPPKKMREPDTSRIDESGSVDRQESYAPEAGKKGYCWRTDLAKTQPYWNDWFDGLSQQLLSAPVQGKFLLLAGIDRLDKTLTIGQMQGKFEMQVLNRCGHAVHEEAPNKVASVVAKFLCRNKFVSPSPD